MIASAASRSWWLARRQAALLSTDRIARSTVLLTANSLVTAAGGLVFWLTAARLYPPVSVGLATAATSMIVLLSGIAELGLGASIIRFSAALGPRRLRRLITTFAITLMAALVASVVFWRLVPYLTPGLTPVFTSLSGLALFVGACTAWTLSLQYDYYLMSQRAMGLLVAKNTLTAGSRALLIVVLPHLSVPMLIAITGASGLIGVVGSIPIVACRRLAPAATSEPPVGMRTLVSYSFWNYLIGLVGTMPTLAMPAIVLSISGGAQAAAYYMAWMLFSVLLMLPYALSWTLLVEGSANPHSGVQATVRKHGRSSLLMLAITALFVPVAVFVLALAGKAYATHGWAIIFLLAMGMLPYHRALLLTTEMRLVGSQWMLTVAYMASQLAFVGISIPLLTLMGASGTAVAWSTSQCLLFFLLQWSVQTSRARQKEYNSV